ncbi:hypothetical protein ACNKHV_14170 [Shigella flexneri]
MFDIQHFAMGNNTTQPANSANSAVLIAAAQVMVTPLQAAPGSIWASFMT